MNKIKRFLLKNRLILGLVVLLIVIAFATKYCGSIDIGDYADTAKFFAGKYAADIRNSHSYLHGFIHAPFLKVFDNYFAFKLTSLIFLFLIIYSIYIITDKNRAALLLALLSPSVWYMAPWINPIQIASLCLLWAWFFMKDYQESGKVYSLFLSAMLIGFGWAFWNTVLFFGIILAIPFLYDKKILHGIYFAAFICVGLIPNFILDQMLFNFAFFSIIKTTASNVLATFMGGIYGAEGGGISLIRVILLLISLPVCFFLLYNKEFIKENTRTMFFVTMSLLLILSNPQLRYSLAIAQIMIVLISENLSFDKIRAQAIIFAIVSAIFILPYVIQIGYNINNQDYGADITDVIESRKLSLASEFPAEVIASNLNDLTENYPGQVFVVGNSPDIFQTLAHFYWGNKVVEFVSIQDYDFVMKNQTSFFEKKLQTKSNINSRREVWIEFGMTKSDNDNTAYKNITYGIGVDEPISIEGFNLTDRYGRIYLSKRIGR